MFGMRREKSAPLEAAKSNLDWGAKQAGALWDNLYAHYDPLIDGRVVLDLGCSWGYMLKYLLERFKPSKVIGVDVSPLWASVPHGWDYQAYGQRLAFHAGLLDEIEELTPRSVDYILCTSVLQYLRPELLLRTLEHAHELLVPGGELLLRTRCFTSYIGADLHSYYEPDYVHLLHPLRDLHRDLLEWRGSAGRYLNYLTASNYVAVFQQSGFEVLHLKRRRSSRAPDVLARVRQMFPWVPEDDLLCAELEARLLRPIDPEDLPTLQREQSTLPVARQTQPTHDSAPGVPAKK